MLINSIFGGVLIQGFLFAAELRRRFPDVPVTEAHPKLLVHARGQDFGTVAGESGLNVDPVIISEANDDRRDAVLAALAARQGFRGNWTHDLAGLDPLCGEEIASGSCAEAGPLLVVRVVVAGACSDPSAAVELRCVECGAWVCA